MGHNSVVLGSPKSTGIPRVDGLSTGPPGFRASQYLPNKRLDSSPMPQDKQQRKKVFLLYKISCDLSYSSLR